MTNWDGSEYDNGISADMPNDDNGVIPIFYTSIY